jgi:cyclopropane-fatty-acyl-phospholipid synthase
LHGLLTRLFDVPPPVRIVGWDQSEAGPPDAPRLVFRSRRAVRRLLWDPSEIGAARAWVCGELDLEGDLIESLGALAGFAQQVGRTPRLSAADKAAVLRTAMVLGAAGPPLRPPMEEVRLSGERHSRGRDKAAVRHHYDLGNDFYRLLLGPSMVYSCAHWAEPSYSLEDAQRSKSDLVCRKLGLRPGMRLLDVGSGWGSLLIHAATEYGVTGLGVTLSEPQAELAERRIAEAGLGDRLQVKVVDYRDLDEQPFDAIASVGMAEHVGEGPFGEYVSCLRELLKPGGRLLNHQITQREAPDPSQRTFVSSYVFPDGELQPLGSIVRVIEDSGLEVRDVESLREHYSATLRAWLRNLESDPDRAQALAGARRHRVWRLYLAISALGFDLGRVSVHQVLAVRPDSGRSGMPMNRTEFVCA